MPQTFRADQRALIWASLATVIAWAVPLVGLLTLPIVYLNTHVHEAFHALAAVMTGGKPLRILVFAEGSGMTPVAGGSPILVASAGYVGAALLGSLLILNMRTPSNARTALRVLAVSLALSMLFWVRGDAVGLFSGAAWAVALWLMAWRMPDHWVLLSCGFIGLQQCLHAVGSLFTLLRISAFTAEHSDALLLQQVTGLPAIVWALAWMAFSLVLIGLGLRGALLSRR